MATVAASPAPVKSSKVLFSACRPIAPRNRVFGKGIIPTRPERLPLGPSPDDAAWLASQSFDPTAPTEEETIGEFLCRTLSPAEYRELRAELDDHFSAMTDRQADEAAEESAMMDRVEGRYFPRTVQAPASTHRVIKSDGVPVAVFLDGIDPSNHAAVTSRAHRVLADLGGLPGVAWIARLGSKIGLMDRDEYADALVFVGHSPIAAQTVETAFEFRLPKAR